MENSYRISVIGLGYVGLPVSVHMASKFSVTGFDIKKERIKNLNRFFDSNGEISSEDLENSKVYFTSDAEDLKNCNFHIVAVPTPINGTKEPDFHPLKEASKLLGEILKFGDIVVYESTVYPGATEEVCLPILESESGLVCGIDFKIGYSPERINPGDTERSFTNIKKIVSGQDSESLKIISNIYGSVVSAGIYEAQSIRVAEAAKVIENTQRDLNIALVNELAIIFDKLDLDTSEVLAAAGSKWNFLPFKPGLVGGHCIGVDPYYLTFKAKSAGYHPDVILAGRKINDSIPSFIISKCIKLMIKKGINIKGSRVVIFGLTFKENCSDIRNSKVLDMIEELIEYGVDVKIFDPWVISDDVPQHLRTFIVKEDKIVKSDALILAVSHKQFLNKAPEYFSKFIKKNSVFIDVKSLYTKEWAEIFQGGYWRL